MGLIFSLFRDKPSTRDTLERIEQELQNIEEKRWDRIKREKLAVQILSFIPMTILIANVCLLIYPSDASWRDKILYSVPIAIVNLALWACKKFVQWYSHWSQDNEEARLRKLQKEKKKILERVCENESYKVATELLEKYDPKQLRYREKVVERPSSPINRSLSKISASPIRSLAPTPAPTPGQQARMQQHIMQNMLNQSISLPTIQNSSMMVPTHPPPTPAQKTGPRTVRPNLANTSLMNMSLPSHNVAASSVQGRPVRPILTKERGFLEKIVDWVVADGPDNRFALICKFCHGHNGMSLAEEYENLNFRCCYCYNLNTSEGRNRTKKVDQTIIDHTEVENKIDTPSKKTESDKKETSESDTLLEESVSKLETTTRDLLETKIDDKDLTKVQEDENETVDELSEPETPGISE